MGVMGFLRDRISRKELSELERRAELVLEKEEEYKKLSDEELKNKTNEFMSRLDSGETLDDIMYEAFAVVREASVRTIGLKPFKVQVVGAIVLHEGRIAEMKTGEGKTLVATMPLYLNALEKKGVHLVTVNDYLAKYQSQWMGKIYRFLGLSVGCLTGSVKGEERRNQYKCDITYGTNNEFGFDYLRDNMAVYKDRRVQRGLNYAIVDEVDSILIDEARTPLIISGRENKVNEMYAKAEKFAKTLSKDDVNIDEKSKSITLSEETGIPKAEKYFGLENISDIENAEISHHINQAIRAKYIMKKDVDYVVKDKSVMIVDEFTGRIMEGRRYSNGLHQAIEAKENIEVKKETQTLATITLQNFFRMYSKLAGMTGTAKTEEDEFREIYNMDVVVVPTNKPVVREDLSDVVYSKENYKWKAIVEEIKRRHETGQPILVGTVSVEVSEMLSNKLKKAGIKHEVLNAKHHEREAQIVAQAGHYKAVTIATNMAGRGTDIMLGGNTEFLIKEELLKKGYEDEAISYALSPFDYDDEHIKKIKKEILNIKGPIEEKVEQEAQKVRSAGGLHVLGTERHEARRIDLQLRGRSGRQGDPGSSQFFLSLEDDLLRIFMKEGVASMMEKMGMQEDVPLENALLTRRIEGAQKKVESKNYGIRKYVLQYDEVMNEQRRNIYEERNRVLDNDNLKDHILNMMKKVVENIVTSNYNEDEEEWNEEALKSTIKEFFFVDISDGIKSGDLTKTELFDEIYIRAEKLYDKREEAIGSETMRDIERNIIISVVDDHWIDHIGAMSDLKQGIGLRAIGQVDPVRAYQLEGFDMYDDMIRSIQESTVRLAYTVVPKTNKVERKSNVEILDASSSSNTVVRKDKKVGRNAPCPCGSGKKYKHCCGRG